MVAAWTGRRRGRGSARGSARRLPGAPVPLAGAVPFCRPSAFAAHPGGAALTALRLVLPHPPGGGSREAGWPAPEAGAPQLLDGLRVEWASAALAGRGFSLPRGRGAVGPSRADLAALSRPSVAGPPSLASLLASRGSGAGGGRHRAASLPPVSSPRLIPFSSSCACRIPVSEGQSMPFGPKSSCRG